MQGVVLAAGRGSRLGRLTEKRSKAMLPILGVPMVGRVIDSLMPADLEEIIVVANPADSELRAYFATSDRYPESVRLVDQAQPRGTADALRCAAPYIQGDFILSACDNLVPVAEIARLAGIWRQGSRPDALLSLQVVPGEAGAETGVVCLEEGKVTAIVEKPGSLQDETVLASLPLYWFSPAILGYLEAVPRSSRGELELQTAIQALIEAGGDVRSALVASRLALTSPHDLLQINRHYLDMNLANQAATPIRAGVGTRLVQPCFIEGDVRIGSGCRIGPYVYLETGSRIGDHVRIRNAVVLRGAEVEDYTCARGEVLA